MNRIKIYMLCLLAAPLFSCTEDFENFTSKAYLNSDTDRTTFLIDTETAEYSASLSVGVPRPAENDISITIGVDMSLITVYNSIYLTDGIELPAENYDLSVAEVTISAGGVRSNDVDIEFYGIDLLDRELVYVLPVTIADAGIEVLESARTHYYVFVGGSLINWGADIEENYFPVNWSNAALVTGMSTVTIEGLLYLRQTEREGSDNQIMTFFGTENSFLIRLGDTFEPGEIMVVKNGTGKYPDNANNRVKAPVGEWFHLAVTHDSSNAVRIYVNGELTSTTQASDGTFSLTPSCYIGRSYNDNRWWPGMICETRVWNTVRTQAEIAEGMFGVDADSPGLLAYWKFDEGSGDTVADHSGNNNTITANAPLIWNSISLP